MRVIGTWKDGDLRITHTLTVDAQNIEEAIEALKEKYPEWTLISVRSKVK